ncbi:hypothetical protein WICMUC_001015 [Wickerhamomyces mucosus]|uniref:peptide chain release factor N(5)-glutamine methyltransferase n=1 Tax=Wickerhamomyces mucosus TaxID=1378264 RepID=A0A9P8PXJ3_9ASCO|nr:hypothetical protein WICMUC_001015 [Wickerhamomyces mucosus]
MVRIPTNLILRARKKSSLLPLLLKPCKTIDSAEQELRWIQNELPQNQWLKACYLRSNNVPLQYILGSQPFGDLNIKCKKDVLIPRWETEEYTLKLVDQLRSIKESLKIIDICTGTGCIPLLLGSKLKNSSVKGIDVSEKAILLSNENKVLNSIPNVEFRSGDVFDANIVQEKYDIVVSNPPYISADDFKSSSTEISVRLYEPKLALVGGNEFYTALVNNVLLSTDAEGFLFEIGYTHQYKHTRNLLNLNQWNTCLYFDSAGNARAIIGWKKGSKMQILENIR